MPCASKLDLLFLISHLLNFHMSGLSLFTTNKHYTHDQQISKVIKKNYEHCCSLGVKSTVRNTRKSMGVFRNSQTEYNLLKLT